MSHVTLLFTLVALEKLSYTFSLVNKVISQVVFVFLRDAGTHHSFLLSPVTNDDAPAVLLYRKYQHISLLFWI